ncbi:MAG: tRNA threonylcarbamoyladenosine dehydratase [Clostridiales bacterium]|mgnify:CR=1 FL=1|jgi:tRNA A37 threonylcarbamoyladenosine dehydratase|nr:tRNA threonylcarbamoyladenosine dehydratase [Clostridiales bacterium]
MENEFTRSTLLLGQEAMDKIAGSRVAVFGVGGVGGYVVEALVRTGLGEIDIIDNDTVALSNINRQIIATNKTLGRYKVDVMKERILDINPNVKVHTYKSFFLPDNSDDFDFTQYDFVVDAIDTVTGKLEIIEKANKANVPVISAMGAGNKLDPTRLEVADIYETSICPLAKVMRRELRARGIKGLKVVYSKEVPLKPMHSLDQQANQADTSKEGVEDKSKAKETWKRRATPGSVSFVPPVAGLIIAGEVIKDLIK